MYSKRESVCVRKERKKEKKKGNVGIEVAKLRLSVCEREGEGHTQRENGTYYQCDQSGRFLKVLGQTNSNKSSPND